MRSKADLSVIILTHNEAIHIERAIRSVAPIATNVFVVDSLSTDQTAALAQALGATVVQHKFVNHAHQFQWALDNLSINTEWIMRLDADEVLTPELIDEIRRTLPLLAPEISGANLRRRHIFLGRWIKHGGRYPLKLLRIWRKGSAKVEQRWMDEHMVLLHGRAVTFRHDFSDYSLNDLSAFTDKHNRYATREAVDRLNQEFGLFASDAAVAAGASNSQARLKRLVKQHLYNRLPLLTGPLFYFLWRYIAQAGFLDGRAGLIYHVMQGFWYRFLVEAKVLELRRVVSNLRTPAEMRAELARLTGLAIERPARDVRPLVEGFRGRASYGVLVSVSVDLRIRDGSSFQDIEVAETPPRPGDIARWAFSDGTFGIRR
jgi:glycosyltransferase involved in cell wall biosynthesis